MDTIVNIDTSNPELLKKPIYQPIEPGTYTFEVANDLEVVKSQSSNNLKINLELVVIDGQEKGRKVFDTLVISPKSMWKIAQFSKSCGVESTGNQLDLKQFKGKVCSAVVKQEAAKNTDGSPKLGPDGVQQFKNVVDEYLFEVAE